MAKRSKVVEGLELAHHLEENKLPSEVKLKKEDMHMALHEKELRALLTPVNLANVEQLGTFEKGKGVKPIPRFKN